MAPAARSSTSSARLSRKAIKNRLHLGVNAGDLLGTGLSGDDLTNRATEQAWLFGAHPMLARADGLTAQGAQRVVRMADGRRVTARAVIIATGITWR